MSLRRIFWSFILSKTLAGQHLVKTYNKKANYQNETLCKYCFSFTKKWTHQNVENSSKWLLADLLSLILWSSTFQDGGWVKFPTLGTFRMSNSLPTWASLSLIPVGCLPPPPPPSPTPILGQTIDRCVKTMEKDMPKHLLLGFIGSQNKYHRLRC